ncbi:hypothetical protein PRUPE_8G120200 [Prunus persica]|uniref:Alpha/beta hydrolase fold-3 domain-containing protein n=1 Tax=Prunus persica TaxID=3760 RepID=M5VKK8_PRUPE|nr:hypothetical protein PRUPE_8G120200 [Prunus persica]
MRRSPEHPLPLAYEDPWEALQWAAAHSNLCSGLNDLRVNPGKDLKLEDIGCGKVLVFVAEKDVLRDRAWAYYEALKIVCGWSEVVEIVESEGQ